MNEDNTDVLYLLPGITGIWHTMDGAFRYLATSQVRKARRMYSVQCVASDWIYGTCSRTVV
jgi:hypothetical protein